MSQADLSTLHQTLAVLCNHIVVRLAACHQTPRTSWLHCASLHSPSSFHQLMSCPSQSPELTIIHRNRGHVLRNPHVISLVLIISQDDQKAISWCQIPLRQLVQTKVTHSLCSRHGARPQASVSPEPNKVHVPYPMSHPCPIHVPIPKRQSFLCSEKPSSTAIEDTWCHWPLSQPQSGCNVQKTGSWLKG